MASDAEVIRRSVGDGTQFTAVFERHFDPIHRYLSRRVGQSLAEDLAAQTFVDAFEKRGRYKSEYPDARSWLYGIATNLVRRHYRDERRQLEAYARGVVADSVEVDVGDVDRRLDALSARKRLTTAIAALNSGDRDALLLFAWAELSYQEIAIALGVPVGTVRSRIHRARGVVKGVLGLVDDPPQPAMKHSTLESVLK